MHYQQTTKTIRRDGGKAPQAMAAEPAKRGLAARLITLGRVTQNLLDESYALRTIQLRQAGHAHQS